MGDEFYPARHDEIQKWGYRAKKISRVLAPRPLNKSFAEAALGERNGRKCHGKIREGGGLTEEMVQIKEQKMVDLGIRIRRRLGAESGVRKSSETA